MIFTILYRTIFFYLLVVIAYKIMGKREVGELSVFDFIISLLIAELISISIENYNESIWFAILPICILVAFQILFSFIALKNNKFRDVVDGKESVIIQNGKLNFKEMTKQRYNLSDLLLQLREMQVRSIEEVDYAILETSGRLSVFKKDDKDNKTFPLPLILDGEIQEDNLKYINKNKKWIKDILNKKKVKLDKVFYAFYKENEVYIIKKDD